MDNKITFLLFELSVSIANNTPTMGKQNSQRLKTHKKNVQSIHSVLASILLPLVSIKWLIKKRF